LPARPCDIAGYEEPHQLKAMLYCKPRFGEGLLGRGMGFGNRLFPWGRCRIFAEVNKAIMISPVWMRPAVGQLFRGGIDYNSYLRQLILFRLFKRRDGDPGVLGGFLKTRNARVLHEPPEPALPFTLQDDEGDKMILFSGWERHFAPLNGWHVFLQQELRSMTRQLFLDVADAIEDVPVGICIRCGNDFAEPSNVDYAPLNDGEKTPIKWFIASLNLIRQAVGHPVKAYVVSDGTKDQLRELLDMENVCFVRPGSAISDLLVLSKAKVLLASGSSSFAAWGAFLGQMPSISHPGQSLKNWGIEGTMGQYIGEFSPSDPADEFLKEAEQLLN